MREEQVTRLIQVAQEVGADATFTGTGNNEYVVDGEVIDRLKAIVKEISDDAYATISRFMERDRCRRQWDVSDHDVLHEMEMYGGGFLHALAKAGFRADGTNLNKLMKAWPELWDEYEDQVVDKRKRAATATASAAAAKGDEACTCGEAYGTRAAEMPKCSYCKGGLNENTSYTRNASSTVGGDAE